MPFTETEKQFARLAVRSGVNVQPGQEMVIGANVRDYEFVRCCMEEAYAAGAKHVSVKWHDDVSERIVYEHESGQTLCDIPQWRYDREKHNQERGACFLSIYSDIPGILKDVSTEKLQAAEKAWSEKMADLQYFYTNNRAQWCVIARPCTEWAKIVFPDLPDHEAYAKLERAIYHASRITDGTDPAKAWSAHEKILQEHAERLNTYRFDALHFKSAQTGTDLTVGLVKDHIWVGGGGKAANGVTFSPNIPTEEVFTMPSRTRVDGVVYASKPLEYNGKLIKGLWLRFEDGCVTEGGAEEEADLLQSLLDFDAGSRRLGEVALVPYDSPISQSGILFYNTLFDENAACHLALGRPYPENLKGGQDMDIPTLTAHDANDSLQHEDFMIGTADMEIDGIATDGKRTPVFRAGNFVF